MQLNGFKTVLSLINFHIHVLLQSASRQTILDSQSGTCSLHAVERNYKQTVYMNSTKDATERSADLITYCLFTEAQMQSNQTSAH